MVTFSLEIILCSRLPAKCLNWSGGLPKICPTFRLFTYNTWPVLLLRLSTEHGFCHNFRRSKFKFLLKFDLIWFFFSSVVVQEKKNHLLSWYHLNYLKPNTWQCSTQTFYGTRPNAHLSIFGQVTHNFIMIVKLLPSWSMFLPVLDWSVDGKVELRGRTLHDLFNSLTMTSQVDSFQCVDIAV